MKVKELIEKLEQLPEYATVRVLQNKEFLRRGYVEEVTLKPYDDDDNDNLERYIDIN